MRISVAKNAARLVARSQQDEILSGHKRGEESEESLARSRREEHLGDQKRDEISAKSRRPKTRRDVDDQTHCTRRSCKDLGEITQLFSVQSL